MAGVARMACTTDPDGVLPLGGSDDLDLDGGGGQGGDLLLHAVSNTGVHGGASGHDGVGVQVLPDVHVALHDGVVGGLVDAAGLHSQEAGLEEGLGAPEPLVADGDDLAVGQLVGLLQGGGGGGGGHLLLEVQGDVAQLLLDVTDDLPLGDLHLGDLQLGDVAAVVGRGGHLVQLLVAGLLGLGGLKVLLQLLQSLVEQGELVLQPDFGILTVGAVDGGRWVLWRSVPHCRVRWGPSRTCRRS